MSRASTECSRKRAIPLVLTADANLSTTLGWTFVMRLHTESASSLPMLNARMTPALFFQSYQSPMTKDAKKWNKRIDLRDPMIRNLKEIGVL